MLSAGKRAGSESETTSSGFRSCATRLRKNDKPVADIHSERTLSTFSCHFLHLLACLLSKIKSNLFANAKSILLVC